MVACTSVLITIQGSAYTASLACHPVMPPYLQLVLLLPPQGRVNHRSTSAPGVPVYLQQVAAGVSHAACPHGMQGKVVND